MKVAIIGYGKEGKANEAYFKDDEIEVIKEYRDEDYAKIDWGQYDLILRSPSVRPQPGFSSGTQYFFDHCPAPIIGVTGTKGKGTTCSMIAAMLEALGEKVFLVGNIGIPAISKLDEIGPNDVVVYELSSFQLWDLTRSPHIAVVLRIAPDHLNVHKDFKEYVAVKGHIAEFQGPGDTVIYFRDNEWSREIAEKSPGEKIPYPLEIVDASTNLTGVDESEKLATEVDGADEKIVDASTISKLLDCLTVPGQHNRENAEAAVLAVAAYLGMEPELLIRQHFDELAAVLANFKGLPHHIEKVRELNGVTYFDDSFSTAEPALEVAIKAFQVRPLVLIAGGQDKGVDLTETKRIIFGAKNLEKVFLIGEIAEKLAEDESKEKFEVVDSLGEAVEKAQKLAEQAGEKAVVLLSPGAASLDMFESYYARGDEFQKLVKELK